jgi:hypothetical protein
MVLLSDLQLLDAQLGEDYSHQNKARRVVCLILDEHKWENMGWPVPCEGMYKSDLCGNGGRRLP